MVVVELQTADGAAVASLAVPPFNEGPAVLIWGGRVFQRHQGRIYREVFAYWAPAGAEVVT